MNEDRRQILELLSQGKITADEAERLIAALDKGQQTDEPVKRSPPKYLRVLVESEDDTKVNVRVPMQLLRAGVRLASLIPPSAREHVNEAMAEHGIAINLAQIKPENLEDFVDHLGEMTVDVDEGDARVRVFCE